MPSYKTTGIVLRRFNLGEADRIITFMTNDRGKLRAVARGVRRIKSRMAGHLELFNEVELMLATGRNLDVITSARLRQHHQTLVDNYDRLSLAYLCAEMTDKLTGDDEPHPEVFALLGQTLGGVESGLDLDIAELYFKLRLAAALGYHPKLDSCVVCGRREADLAYFFSPAQGGIVDDTCRTGEALPMPTNQIKFWRLALNQSLEQLVKVENGATLAGESLRICNLFYDQVFGRRFDSAKPA